MEKTGDEERAMVRASNKRATATAKGTGDGARVQESSDGAKATAMGTGDGVRMVGATANNGTGNTVIPIPTSPPASPPNDPGIILNPVKREAENAPPNAAMTIDSEKFPV